MANSTLLSPSKRPRARSLLRGLPILPILIAWAATATAAAEASNLYSNTTNQLPIRYNPGAANIIVFDDTPIERSLLEISGIAAPFVAIDSLTLGIRRVGNSPAVTLSFYAAAFQNGFLDFNLSLDPSTVTLLGTRDLAASSITQTTPITLALGSNPVNIPVAYFGDYGYLAIGVAFSDPSISNGWRLMNSLSNQSGIGCYEGVGPGPSNIGCFWEFDTLSQGQFIYAGFNTTAGSLAASFYGDLQGSPALAPSPSPLPLLGGLAAFTASRRLRQRMRWAIQAPVAPKG